MRDTDTGAFYAMLDDLATLLQRPGQPALSPTGKAMYFRAMAGYDLATVRAALDAHVRDPQRGRFMPVPADLIAQIQAAEQGDGRPGAEEAWAIAVRARDEGETVVWTAEICEAWGVARTVLELGDEVGARMAFKEAYVGLLDRARRARTPVAWTASLGFDSERRQLALEAASATGRLQRSEAFQLTAPASAPLLALGQASGAPAHVIAALRALADRLRARGLEPGADAQEKARTRQLQESMAQRVNGYASDRGMTA